MCTIITQEPTTRYYVEINFMRKVGAPYDSYECDYEKFYIPFGRAVKCTFKEAKTEALRYIACRTGEYSRCIAYRRTKFGGVSFFFEEFHHKYFPC